MSYITSLRNARMNSVRDAIAGGTFYICSGAKPSTPALPGAGAILSQHTLPGTIPDAAGGVLTIASGIGVDTAANNTGAPGYTAFANAAGQIVACKSLAELALTVTYPSGDTQVVAGREMRVNSIALTEGNA